MENGNFAAGAQRDPLPPPSAREIAACNLQKAALNCRAANAAFRIAQAEFFAAVAEETEAA